MFVDPYGMISIEGIPCIQRTSYPPVCIMYHTGQECRFVLKVADAETFQTSNTTPTDGVCAVGAISIGLSLEFRIVPTGEAKLANIRNNYKCASKDAFIAGLRALD
jgi:hypothetical protein